MKFAAIIIFSILSFNFTYALPIVTFDNSNAACQNDRGYYSCCTSVLTASDAYPSEADVNVRIINSSFYNNKVIKVINEDGVDSLTYRVDYRISHNILESATPFDITGGSVFEQAIPAGNMSTINFAENSYEILVYIKNTIPAAASDYRICFGGRS